MVVLLLITSVVSAQEALEEYNRENIIERGFDRQAWSELTEPLDYSRVNDQQRKKKETIRSNDGIQGQDYESNSPWGAFNVVLGSWFLKVIVIVLAIVAIVFLLRALIGRDFKRNKKIDTGQKITVEELEDRLEEAALTPLIEQALKAGDYRLAVRLYYLSVLQCFSQKKLITWKKDKTNREYLRELSSTAFYDSFRNITGVFERVWYGQHALDARQYARLEPQFTDLLKALNQGNEK